MYGVLLGEINFQLGDVADAASYLVEAARISGDEALYERAAEMAVRAHSADLALRVTEAWHEAYPDSLKATRYELQVLLATGRVAASEAPLRKLLQALPDDEKTALITAMPAFFERTPDSDGAAQVVEQVLTQTAEDPKFAAAAWTTIGRMRLRSGDTRGALTAAKLGQTADREAQWPAILALQLLAEGPSELAESAESVVTGYLKQPKADPGVRMGYAQVLIEDGRYDQAREQLQAVTANHPERAQAWLLKGILDENMRQDDSARKALEHYLELATTGTEADADITPSGPDRARLALAQIAQRRGDDAQAMSWLDAVDSDEQALSVQLQRAELLARQGHIFRARAAIANAPEYRPADARIKLLAEARLLRDYGQPKEAYKLLNEALQAAPDDEDLLYDTAMAAERLDDVAEMERLLRRLIALHPDAAHAYNALGYSLAERGLRLQEAQSLVEKAVQLSPQDGYIQDSLGWVQYKLGHLEQARDTLAAAYDRQPDAEIAAHLGEVLWQLGEHDAARATWRRGQQLDPSHEAIKQTMQRLGATP